MKVIIAPQAFKGTLTGSEVATAIEKGILMADPTIKTHTIPVSDGGDGFLEIILSHQGGNVVESTTTGPTGAKITAEWGMIPEKNTAIIELAKVCGLALIPNEQKNPLTTTSYGVGEIILEALDKGIRKFLIGIGGSGTNDAGVGILQALGGKFFDSKGKSLPHGGGVLIDLTEMDLAALDPRLKECTFIVGCDVTNPFTGPEGATRVYAEQKGATENAVERLEKGLTIFADLVQKKIGVDLNSVQGSGAAGGVGGGLHGVLGARLVPGIEVVLEQIGFDKHLERANLVITGEGKMDSQTVFNKGPVGVAKKAKEKNIPVVAIVGSIGNNFHEVHNHGIDSVIPLCFDRQYGSENANAKELLTTASEEVLRIFTL